MSIEIQAKLQEIENVLAALIKIVQEQKCTDIFTQKELLKLLQISPNTLKSWEDLGLQRLEPPIEGTRCVYYQLSEVIKFLTL